MKCLTLPCLQQAISCPLFKYAFALQTNQKRK